MKNREFLPPAEEEMNEAARFYEERSPGLGRAFLDEVQRTIDAIALIPTPAGSSPRTSGVALSNDFPLERFIQSNPSELSSSP